MKLAKGMTVRVLPRKPEWEDAGPCYVNEMTEYENDTFVIEEVSHNEWVQWQGYSWDMDWLAPADMENE